MKITNLDNERCLFKVTNLLADNEAADVLSLDWPTLPWSKGFGQESWPRKAIDMQHPDVAKVSTYISNRLDEINRQLGTDFKSCSGNWWLDEPGFTVGIHTDGELPATMQIYWVAPSSEFGTCFYNNKLGDVKYHFKSEPNTGYIMLNRADKTGYRILQWHGMTNPVPPNTWRLSSYWYFYK
jgi:hypothetical protein